jgi:hypothetical protein
MTEENERSGQNASEASFHYNRGKLAIPSSSFGHLLKRAEPLPFHLVDAKTSCRCGFSREAVRNTESS